MSDKIKYNFLFGTKVDVKEFENDDAAIAEAKGIEGCLRVQNDKTGKRIFTNDEAVAKYKEDAAPVIVQVQAPPSKVRPAPRTDIAGK